MISSPFSKQSIRRPAAAAVTLEGRTRLPNRVQDLIVELGNSVTSIQQAPGISDALLTSIRNFATVEGIAQNSSLNLEKLTKQLDRMDAQTSGIERGLDRVADVLDRVNSLEQNGYCSVVPSSSISSFTKSSINTQSQDKSVNQQQITNIHGSAAIKKN